MENGNKESLEFLEHEFIQACKSYDMEKVANILRKDKSKTSFFCSVSIIRGCQEEFKQILNDMPEDLKDVAGIIKRMTFSRKVQTTKTEVVDEEIIQEKNQSTEVEDKNSVEFVIED